MSNTKAATKYISTIVLKAMLISYVLNVIDKDENQKSQASEKHSTAIRVAWYFYERCQISNFGVPQPINLKKKFKEMCNCK